MYIYLIYHLQGSNNDLHISIGHGPDIENYLILEYVDATPYEINAIGVTSEYNQIADWTFSKIEGMV